MGHLIKSNENSTIVIIDTLNDDIPKFKNILQIVMVDKFMVIEYLD